tara:strand:+ start:88 stop:609 length:522 start_codon:yes stop_codon:yes gene_type:complete
MENICDWKKCTKIAKYKAPMEKDNSRNFRWLCLDHIKEFNKKWDYFSGMSEEQIFNFLKSDITWHKPTQSFGSSGNFFNILWDDALNSRQGFDINKLTNKNNSKIKNFNNKDVQAFKVMELEIGSKWQEIHIKFKTLVKKFHPDMNAGNKIFENKLKNITLAYSQLKITYREK